jgi:hypothetical protein
MRSPSRRTYLVDPDDPRAPPLRVWARMTPAQRARVVDSLPSSFPLSEASPPEGDIHLDVVYGAKDALQRHFRRLRKSIYVAANMAVYYPGERMFSPDLFAVLDVEDRRRDSWVVAAEAKGLDFALEVHWRGRKRKDEVEAVERYARLGIAEYAFCDLHRRSVRGWRLPEPGFSRYQPVVPQGGRIPSAVLGVDLMIEGDRLRFVVGHAPVPYADELIARLDSALAAAEAHVEAETQRAEAEAQRAEAEAQRAEAEAQRAGAEAERAETQAQRARELEQRLAQALARLEGTKPKARRPRS